MVLIIALNNTYKRTFNIRLLEQGTTNDYFIRELTKLLNCNIFND